MHQPPKRPPKTELEKQTAIYYKKLKREGFDDIEYPNGSIRSAFPKNARNKAPDYWEHIHEYYYVANHFLHEYQFETKIDKIIWTYHAEGLSVRDIANTLKKVKIKKKQRGAVHNTIKRLESIMKKMYWQT